MGSKGTQTTTAQNTGQSYTANPAIAGAANQAITGAQSAASQPFQMPVAPVAGFNPTQQQAFQQYSQLQGMAQPYFAAASNFANQSAAPISASDVNNYYNPMADNVTKQLQNIYGEQNVQNQGNLTAQAGGVGADRIAVGMGDLANQQGLASGQVYSNLYQQALSAAQQQKQMEAGAGNAMASYGTGAQSAQLQGTGALNQAGNQQQQQTQAQLNAPYQNLLAQIAYQFQTPQYLAGITGGLAPALGGTTVGNQNTVTTPPQPSILSQIAGLGTAGAGIYGALGGFNSPSYGGGSAFSGDAYGGSSGSPLPGLSPSDYGSGYADGGEVDQPQPPPSPPPQIPKPFGWPPHFPWDQKEGPGTTVGRPNGKADGGEVDDSGPAIPGMSIPKTNGSAEPIPLISMHPGAGHSGPLTGGIQFSQPQQQQAAGDSTMGDIAKVASSVLPFFLKRGGSVYPHYDDGGATFDDRFGAAFPNANPPASPDSPSPIPGIRPGSLLDKGYRYFFPDKLAPEVNPSPVPPGTTPLPKAYPGPGKLGADTPAYRLDPPAKSVPDDDEEEIPAKTTTPTPKQTVITSPPYQAVADSMLPQSRMPYPDALSRDAGQEAVRSPWLALVKAGATMAATPGPLGVSIGKGLLAGTTGLETQRTALQKEQDLNDKAQELYEKSMEHLDKYNRMTPYEQASITARNREIDQSGETGDLKSIDVQRYYKALNESADESVMKLSTQQKLTLAAHMAAHGGNAIGAELPFDNGKGGTVIGVWDGKKWSPKNQ